MYIIAYIAWILMWGAAGYFTVRVICTRIATKRMEREFMMYTNAHPWIKVVEEES